MEVILDNIKRADQQHWDNLARSFNQNQIDLFAGLEDFVEKYSRASTVMEPEEIWEVYKLHPFTKAIMDAAINQYMEYHHLL